MSLPNMDKFGDSPKNTKRYESYAQRPQRKYEPPRIIP